MEKVFTPAVEERKKRLDMAHKILVAKRKTNYKRAVALLSYNLGITERKAKEYIDTLIMVDGIRREGDLIVRTK